MRRLIFWSLTAALAGFLFGFDTIVISGSEQKIESLWVLLAVPETKGISLEAIQSQLGISDE